MKEREIHLGSTPSYDLVGNLVSNIFFDNRSRKMVLSLERGMKVERVVLTYEEALSMGLINLNVLKPYFNKF